LIINLVRRKLRQVMQTGVDCLESRLRQWTRPAKHSQVMNVLVDLTRSRRELAAENMFLRQQLIVLGRQGKRPHVIARDRQILVLLASRLGGWREALVVVSRRPC
jgi:hypothetical protein